MKRRMTMLVLAAATVLLSVFSCRPESVRTTLDRPEPVVASQSATSFTVTWEPVADAFSYRYILTGPGLLEEEIATETPSVSCRYMQADAEYLLRVQAVADPAGGLSDSEWAEIAIPLQSLFHVGLEVDGRTVSVRVRPDNPELTYYAEVITDYQYREEMGGNPDQAYATILDYYAEIFGNGTFDFLKDVGDLDFTMEMPLFGEKSHVILAGIDESLEITTDVEMYAFETEPLPVSENTFVIKLLELSASTASVEVTPSNDDPYTMVLVESDDLEGYTDEEIYSLMAKEYSGWINNGHVYTGYMVMNYSTGLLPSTDYTLLVFGWNTQPNTDINRFEFATEEGGPGAGVTFEMFAEVQGPYEIFTRVTPSDNQVYYFYDLVSEADYEAYEGNMKRYIEDICAEGGIDAAYYAEMFAVAGESEMLYDYMEPETSYYLYAMAIEIVGEEVVFYEPFFYDKILTTPAE